MEDTDKIIKEREFEDEWGLNGEQTLQNGIKITYNIEPSQKLLDKLAVMREISRPAREKIEYADKIAAKLKEMAEKELEKESEL